MVTTGTVPSGHSWSAMHTGRASLGAALSVTAGIGTSLLKSGLSFVGLLISRFVRRGPAACHASRLDRTAFRHNLARRNSDRNAGTDENSAVWRRPDSSALPRNDA